MAGQGEYGSKPSKSGLAEYGSRVTGTMTISGEPGSGASGVRI
jgi:hypothetical protein